MKLAKRVIFENSYRLMKNEATCYIGINSEFPEFGEDMAFVTVSGKGVRIPISVLHTHLEKLVTKHRRAAGYKK